MCVMAQTDTPADITRATANADAAEIATYR